MCRCFRFFYGVVGNLAQRLFAELSRVPYEMCWCLKTESVPDIFQQAENTIAEEFYKEISRDAAEKLLRHKQCGTFIIRPSKTSPFGTLSVVQDGKFFHLNTRVRHQDGYVALGREKLNEKCFPNLDALINYYISNYLVLNSASEGTKYLTLLLPYRDETI